LAQLLDAPHSSKRKSPMFTVTHALVPNLYVVAQPGTPEKDALQNEAPQVGLPPASSGQSESDGQPCCWKSAKVCHWMEKPAGAPVAPAQNRMSIDCCVAASQYTLGWDS